MRNARERGAEWHVMPADVAQRVVVKQEGEGGPAPPGAAVPPASDQTAVKPEPEDPREETPEEVGTLSSHLLGLTSLHSPLIDLSSSSSLRALIQT